MKIRNHSTYQFLSNKNQKLKLMIVFAGVLTALLILLSGLAMVQSPES